MPVTRVTVDRDDRGRVAEYLNSNASTFAGFTFDGWHAAGQSFTAPEIEGSEIITFGCVYTGPVNNFQAFGDGEVTTIPQRFGTFLISVYMSRHSETLWGDVLAKALEVLSNENPLDGLEIMTQTWRGPNGGDSYGEAFPDFVSEMGEVEYRGF